MRCFFCSFVASIISLISFSREGGGGQESRGKRLLISGFVYQYHPGAGLGSIGTTLALWYHDNCVLRYLEVMVSSFWFVGKKFHNFIDR